MMSQVVLPCAMKCKGVPVDEFLKCYILALPRSPGQQEEEDEALRTYSQDHCG